VERDVLAGKNGAKVMTRFPPEPNGYLHIGHAKSICLNFGIAGRFAGAACNLRFDDTNPTTEDDEYVKSIQADVRWLGFDWGDRLYFASDYFERLYEIARTLIQAGKAYVDSQTLDEIRAGRGDFYHPGRVSPYRDRSVAENLDLFARMRAGDPQPRRERRARRGRERHGKRRGEAAFRHPADQVPGLAGFPGREQHRGGYHRAAEERHGGDVGAELLRHAGGLPVGRTRPAGSLGYQQPRGAQVRRQRLPQLGVGRLIRFGPGQHLVPAAPVAEQVPHGALQVSF